MMRVCVVFVALVLHLTEANYAVKYLGCFGDDYYTRALNGAYVSWTGASVDWCVERCNSQGYKYAGLQFYDECRCGNSGYDKYGARQRCNARCRGNRVQICGGSYMNSIYEIVPVTTTPPSSETTVTTPYTPMPTAGLTQLVYLGCFESITQLDDYIQQDDLTVEACLDHCNETGYRYAGLYDGDRCICGDSRLVTSRKRWDRCGLSCAGNSSQICGGYSYDSYNNSYYYRSVYIRVSYTVKHLGCYYDGSPRALEDLNATDVDAVSTCVDHCDSQGYRYAGLQYGQLCRCGNHGYDRYGEAPGCNSTCVGDNSQLCGGYYQNSVYEIVYPAVTTTTESSTVTVSGTSNVYTSDVSEETKENNKQLETNVGVYAGSAVAAVVASAVVVVIVVVVRRRMNSTTGSLVNETHGDAQAMTSLPGGNVEHESVQPPSTYCSLIMPAPAEVKNEHVYTSLAGNPAQDSYMNVSSMVNDTSCQTPADSIYQNS